MEIIDMGTFFVVVIVILFIGSFLNAWTDRNKRIKDYRNLRKVEEGLARQKKKEREKDINFLRVKLEKNSAKMYSKNNGNPDDQAVFATKEQAKETRRLFSRFVELKKMQRKKG